MRPLNCFQLRHDKRCSWAVGFSQSQREWLDLSGVSFIPSCGSIACYQLPTHSPVFFSYSRLNLFWSFSGHQIPNVVLLPKRKQKQQILKRTCWVICGFCGKCRSSTGFVSETGLKRERAALEFFPYDFPLCLWDWINKISTGPRDHLVFVFRLMADDPHSQFLPEIPQGTIKSEFNDSELLACRSRIIRASWKFSCSEGKKLRHRFN